jgi:hypothetical protein
MTLREVTEAVSYLAKRGEAERNEAKVTDVVRPYRRRDRLNWFPSLTSLVHRIDDAQTTVKQLRPALYVAEHGPIFEPFPRIARAARTVFDQVLDDLSAVLASLEAAMPPELGAENCEAWNALKPRTRAQKMQPLYFAALQAFVSPALTIDVDMNLARMWVSAVIGHRLMETLGVAHQSLLDGSLCLAEIGYLARDSSSYTGRIDNPYPDGHFFPEGFKDEHGREDRTRWRQYALLMRRLRDIAPKVGAAESDVADSLCTAEYVAQRFVDSDRCDSPKFQRTLDRLDPIKFSQVYVRIRRAIADRLQKFIPDRDKMWAEALDACAVEVSLQDASRLQVEPPTAITSQSHFVDKDQHIPSASAPAQSNVTTSVPDGFYSPTDIATAMNAPDKSNAIRMALKRLFDKGRLPDGAWMENSNPAKGQAKILYRLSAVRPLLTRFDSSKSA